MRRTLFVLTSSMVLLSGCGNSATFADRPRPPVPVNLTVYINDRRVSLSPGSVGAGEVTFDVTNQASTAQSLRVSGGGADLATTGPINPMGTAQVSVDLSSPGRYTISTGSGGGTDASLSSSTQIQPATLQVSSARAADTNHLLTP